MNHITHPAAVSAQAAVDESREAARANASAALSSVESVAPMEPCNRILTSNLIGTFQIAVNCLSRAELAAHGPAFRSCFRADLEANLAALRAGETLTIVES